MALTTYQQLKSSGGAYAVYVLAILLLTYLLNQLDRYIVSIISGPIARTVHFGDLACMSPPKDHHSHAGNHTHVADFLGAGPKCSDFKVADE